jgi:sucrose phosphorylase
MVRFPDGRNVPYWNTFYQEVQYKNLDTQDVMAACNNQIQYLTAEKVAQLVNSQLAEGKNPSEIDFGKYSAYKDAVTEQMEASRRYLGQMDLNIKSPLVWEHYENTLKQLSEYGARIVRLDAFAYAPKEPGEKNFLNDPGTWDLLEKVKALADKYNVTLLPEIHASYGEKIYELVSKKGYMTYDFFLPGLMIYAIEHHDGEVLARWAREQVENNIRTVNMLGCHDGIPLLDLKGFLADEEIEEMIDLLVKRGGFVKNLHGQKNMYYQVNATYYSALGDDDKKLLFARAVQMFMPGKPQVWYLDLFAGKNDHAAVERAGAGGHKEINRTNLSTADVEAGLQKPVVQEQLKLLSLRNTHPAFGFDSKLDLVQDGSKLTYTWTKGADHITLEADFATYEYTIK